MADIDLGALSTQQLSVYRKALEDPVEAKPAFVKLCGELEVNPHSSEAVRLAETLHNLGWNLDAVMHLSDAERLGRKNERDTTNINATFGGKAQGSTGALMPGRVSTGPVAESLGKTDFDLARISGLPAHVIHRWPMINGIPANAWTDEVSHKQYMGQPDLGQVIAFDLSDVVTHDPIADHHVIYPQRRDNDPPASYNESFGDVAGVLMDAHLKAKEQEGQKPDTSAWQKDRLYELSQKAGKGELDEVEKKEYTDLMHMVSTAIRNIR